MINPISINDFISLPNAIPLVDVRTPAEFEQGKIPGAFNIPLFTNEERVIVGTTYKQVGREQAILLGFDLTGSKWSGFIKQALEIAPLMKIGVHCWRGGMRSGAMAWALNLYGFEVYLIEGGYKNYRKWTIEQFEKPYQLTVLGGMTGSGKTQILHQLQSINEQVIDLEGLAQHQGSAYGSMNILIQPTQEQFENDLALQLKQLDPCQRTWVEDESLTIGQRCIPHPFWDQMCDSLLLNINVPQGKRVEMLVEEYCVLDAGFLISCTERLKKRLGLEQTKLAVQAIEENRMADFIRIVLVYYDKTYATALSKRNKEGVVLVNIDRIDLVADVNKILNAIHSEQPTINDKNGN
ncbi:Selenophosphate-dependent tRNA 2-selenouridine synthase [Arcticibacter svalbardensis MN12-7]|uniref:Selenophosphate-dependent tRNA 2-selenouridine synthase n=1 Tax=Arcticibacter svalbardensis MN12-7 TaxID=1150600 RepID=R9GTN8_9SPHI|nr:tRNA 2-selenouridine(34) synthase MnmH [Arcticibacter svalbardensis]EOR95076.1 Selenophosphate-dependent tRNA 2-selenouridine synthase [Arcticibacter svalbardensis MN12-7]